MIPSWLISILILNINSSVFGKLIMRFLGSPILILLSNSQIMSFKLPKLTLNLFLALLIGVNEQVFCVYL